jgi:threonine aldolase
MIDLRSDTVTRPTDEMREAMAGADVGDDVYGGKEAAVFVPTGSMSNQIALRAHTEPGDLVIIDRHAHIILNEGGAGAALSGVTMRPIDGAHGVFGPDEVVEALGQPHPFNPTTLGAPPRLVCLENTHNAGGGSVWPLDQLEAVCHVGREHGLALHLDGARLWHASAASGVPAQVYAEPFDTVNVCFSKGLGAPVGSALAGPGETIERARRFRQQFGGGMRQAGVIAAGALHALEHHRDDLRRDVDNARRLALALAVLDGVALDPSRVESNIVRFHVSMDAGDFASACHGRGVHMLPNGRHGVRAVLHRDVSDIEVDEAVGVMGSVLAGAPVRGPT